MQQFKKATSWEWDSEKYNENSMLQYKAFMALAQKYQFRCDEEILDIGCGDGKITKELSGKIPKGRILGIDVSRNMIEFAKTHYQADNLTFELWDAENICSLNRKFDLVVSSFALHWVRNKIKTFQGVKSCLKPEGKAILIMPHRNQLTAKIKEEMILEPQWKEYFFDYTDPTLQVENCDYKQYAIEAGLEVTSYETYPVTTYFKTTIDLKNFLRSITPHLTRLPSDEFKNRFMDEFIMHYLSKNPAEKDGSCSVTYTYVNLLANSGLALKL